MSLNKKADIIKINTRKIKSYKLLKKQLDNDINMLEKENEQLGIQIDKMINRGK